MASVLEGLRRWTGGVAAPLLVLAGVPALVWLAYPTEAVAWGQGLTRVEPLEIGLGEERLAMVEALAAQTNEQARILWEDRRGPRHGSRWTALLPVLSERAFVGGLDSEGGIEHAVNGLVDESLAGRPLEEWTDEELEDYCRRYNIGWVVCWSEGACKRFARWSMAGTAKQLPATEEGQARLFTLDRLPSFALTGGSVCWRSADARRILLADAVPAQSGEDGQIVLSLHYQSGMRVSPSRVRIEQAVDSRDTIPFVRLRMSEPVGRIMITWDGR